MPAYLPRFLASAFSTVSEMIEPLSVLPSARISPVSPSTSRTAGMDLIPYIYAIRASQYMPS